MRKKANVQSLLHGVVIAKNDRNKNCKNIERRDECRIGSVNERSENVTKDVPEARREMKTEERGRQNERTKKNYERNS